MRLAMLKKTLLLVLLSSPLIAGTHVDQFGQDQQGEYFEYDLVGTRKDHVKREMVYHSKQVVTAPFKAVGKCFSSSRDAIKASARAVEGFLTDANSIDGRRGEFKRAMREFEANAEFGDYYIHELDGENAQCMFGLPTATLKLLKNILFTAGFVFPRATWHTIKAIFRGTCTCVNG